MQFISKWTEKLHKQHTGINFFLRDGFIGGSVGKSVDHMHFHLIPSIRISLEDIFGIDREFMDKKQYLSKIKKAKKIYK